MADAPTYGAVLSPSGTVLSVPHALDAGRPKPEPADRWTLGPDRHSEPEADVAQPVVTSPVHALGGRRRTR